MIQIAQLLEERSMSFSFCLNKADVSVLCAMALLYQSLELKPDSKVMKDNERLVNVVLKTITRMKAPATYDLRRVSGLVVSIDEPQHSLPTPPGQSPDTSMAAPPPQKSPASKPKKKPAASASQHQQHYSIGRHSSMSETDLLLQQEKLKRMTMPNITPVAATGRQGLQRSMSRASLDGGRPSPASVMQRRDQRMSMSQASMIARVSPPQQKTSLDYMALGAQPSPTLPAQSGVGQQQQQQQQQQQPAPPTTTQRQHQSSVSPTMPAQPFYSPVQVPQKSSCGGMSSSEWETLLGQIDGGQANLYDAIYGGPQVTLETPVPSSVSDGNWTPDALDLSTFNLGDFGGGGGGGGEGLSEESLSSVSGGDDLSNLDFREFAVGHQGAMMGGDGFVLDGMARDSSSFGI